MKRVAWFLVSLIGLTVYVACPAEVMCRGDADCLQDEKCTDGLCGVPEPSSSGGSSGAGSSSSSATSGQQQQSSSQPGSSSTATSAPASSSRGQSSSRPAQCGNNTAPDQATPFNLREAATGTLCRPGGVETTYWWRAPGMFFTNDAFRLVVDLAMPTNNPVHCWLGTPTSPGTTATSGLQVAAGVANATGNLQPITIDNAEAVLIGCAITNAQGPADPVQFSFKLSQVAACTNTSDGVAPPTTPLQVSVDANPTRGNVCSATGGAFLYTYWHLMRDVAPGALEVTGILEHAVTNDTVDCLIGRDTGAGAYRPLFTLDFTHQMVSQPVCPEDGDHVFCTGGIGDSTVEVYSVTLSAVANPTGQCATTTSSSGGGAVSAGSGTASAGGSPGSSG